MGGYSGNVQIRTDTSSRKIAAQRFQVVGVVGADEFVSFKSI